MKGRRITTLQELHEARRAKRSVCCPSMHVFGKTRAKPAAFVMNMSGHVLWRMIEEGLYIYEKGEPQ